MSALSDLREDLARSSDAFGKVAVVLLRGARVLGPLGLVPDILLRLLCGAEVTRHVQVGPGLRMAHGSRGSVVHPKAVIGSRVTLYHGVTLGVSGPDQRAPRIRDDVYIGTGACILGGVTVGAGAKIGANDVVVKDVPPGATAVGIPARVLAQRD